MVWDLIESGHSSAFDNMAVDEAIFDTARHEPRSPVLRLYGWRPTALSIGYFQPAGEVHQVRWDREGVDFVRRPTGGSAILHAHELTYSLCIHTNGAGGRRATELLYIAVNKALIKGLAALGVRGRMLGSDPVRQANGSPFCFAKPSKFDIMVAGRKLIGSAQRRRGSAILQHGSIPIADPHAAPEATSLEDERGRDLCFEDVADRIRHGFEAHFAVNFHRRKLMPGERQLAAHLAHAKYRTEQWNFRR